VYNILIQSGIPMKLVRLIKVGMVETCIQSPGKQNIRLICFLLRMCGTRRCFIAIAFQLCFRVQ
jgi:hypothetical protein